MALWRKNSALSNAEQERRRKKREKREKESVIRKGAFYHYWEPPGVRTTEHIESADNRRAAGIYVRNF